MYITRNIEKCILDASKKYPVIMVCGQRQVGKSTMLNHIKEEKRTYVSFDNRQIRRLAETDPKLFFETYKYPLIIDEFQKVPQILEDIKDIIDRLEYEGKDNNGLFWLTGSQKFNLMKGISESLAGRVAIYELSSLSQREMDKKDGKLFNPDINEIKKEKFKYKDVDQIYENIFNGGMPKLFSEDIDREKYYADYINTYLERDIKELSSVDKLNEFYDFLVFIAARTGQELKYDEISKQIGISSPTVKSWITILERSGIIFILHPYYSKVTDRLVKTPKIYFMDTGLAAYLCRWSSSKVLQHGNMDGAFFETFVVSEIIKSYYNSGKPINNLYYYRDIDKKEIDLVIVDAESIYPIEIKKNKDPSNPDKNFSALNKFGLDVKPGLVICLSEEIMPINRNCYLVPVSMV